MRILGTSIVNPLCFFTLMAMSIRLVIASSSTQPVPENAPEIYRMELKQIIARHSIWRINVEMSAAEAAERVASQLEDKSIPFLKSQVRGKRGIVSAALARHVLARKSEQAEAVAAIDELVREDLQGSGGLAFLALASAPPETTRHIVTNLLDESPTQLDFQTRELALDLLARTGNEESLALLGKFRDLPEWTDEYRQGVDERIALLQEMLALEPAKRMERHRLESLFWLACVDRPGNHLPSSDYSDIAEGLERDAVRFPVDFLLSKLPKPGEPYDVREGRKADPAALAIAILGQQREAAAIDELKALADNASLAPFVKAALAQIDSSQE